MNRKILLLALLPACPTFAQTIDEHEDIHTAPAPSAMAQQIMATRLALSQPLTPHHTNAEVHLSPTGEVDMLKESVDYFAAEDLLNGSIDPKVPHEINTTRYSNVTLSLDGQNYENLECYEISDRYSIVAAKELPGDFQYNNTYFLYRDKEGKTLATISYIDCSIGNLKTENKVVRRGLSALLGNTLSLAPNPAHTSVGITSRITAAGTYSLQVSSLDGRTLKTVFNQKQLSEGLTTTEVPLDLPAGTYSVILNSDHSAPVTQKLIIK